MSPDFDFDEYKANILKEIYRESKRDNPISQRLKIIEFTSRSAGRGRKRKERGVSLLVVDDTYAYVIKDHEVKSRMRRDHIAPDVLANEILSNLPAEERSTDMLLKILNSIG